MQHINGITLAVWFKFSGLFLALSQSKILNHRQRKSQINKNILAYNKMSHANRKFLSSLFWQLSVAKYATLTFTSPFPVPSYFHLLSSAWKIDLQSRVPHYLPTSCHMLKKKSLLWLILTGRRPGKETGSWKALGSKVTPFSYSQNVQFMVLGLVPSILSNKPSSHTLPVKSSKPSTGVCCQAWWLKFNSGNLHSKRELTPTSCSIIFTCTPWYVVTCAHIHMHTHIHIHTYRKTLTKQFTTSFWQLKNKDPLDKVVGAHW